jgi:hypothetical protein
VCGEGELVACHRQGSGVQGERARGWRAGWDPVDCERVYLGIELAAAAGFSSRDRQTAPQLRPCMKLMV